MPGQPFDVAVDHHGDQPGEIDRGRPAEILAGFRGIADQVVDLSGPEELWVDVDVLPPVEAGVAERHLDEVADGMALAGRHDVVVGRRLLEHEPHRADVVPGKSPVAVRLEVAEVELLLDPELDSGDPVRYLARDELEAAARRLVIEQDAGAGEQPVALPVVDRDVMPEHLRHAIRAARVERRQLGLRHLAHLAEHLARGGLVDLDLRIDAPDRIQHPRHALGVELAGQQGLVPRRGDERHGGQVVELVRLVLLDGPDEREPVEQVGRVELDAIQQVRDPVEVGMAQSADDAGDLVPVVEQQFGQVRPVLPRDAGDDGALRHTCVPLSVRESNRSRISREEARRRPPSLARA